MFVRRRAVVSRLKYWTLSAALLLVACIQTSSGLPQPAFGEQENQNSYVISETVNLVELPVTVRDSKGQFVSGLEQPNFQVYENGLMRDITLFRNEDVPVTAGLVVDHSGSMGNKRDEVMQGARAFVQASNPQDRDFVVNFSDTVTFGLPPDIPFTSNTEDLQAALLATPLSGKTALYDAVAAALQRLQKDKRDKKVLLLISDGGDNASRHNFSEVLRMAQAANVVIYTVGLFDENAADQNPKVLKKFAADTGAQVYFPMSPTEVVSVCKEIAADIRHQYTLGYSPPNPEGGGYRPVRVKVNAPSRGKLSVRTRAGYFLPSKTTAQSGAPQG
jgi:Ca-activated chloride channel family protein